MTDKQLLGFSLLLVLLPPPLSASGAAMWTRLASNT